jgi:serine/threonine protein phosphatase 1
MALSARGRMSNFQAWTWNGGGTTSASYDFDLDKMFEELEWFKTLPLYLEFDEELTGDGRRLVVSHSSVSGVWKYRDSSDFKQHVLWNRLPVRDEPDIYNVFGHTPQQNKPCIETYYACIDRGSYFPRDGYGYICALQFPSLEYFEVKVES